VDPPETSSWADVSRRTVNDAAYVRLRSELTAAIPEFELLVGRTDSEGESWVVHGRDLLRRSVNALEDGTLDEAWRHYHSAQRLEIYGLEQLERTPRVTIDTADDADSGGRSLPDDQPAGSDAGSDSRSSADPAGVGESALQVRAKVVFEEAMGALDGWRRSAVRDLLADEDDELESDVTGAELRAASRLLHEHYEGIYLARSEQQRQFNQLVLMGVVSGVALFVLSVADWLFRDVDGGLLGDLGTFVETPFVAGNAEITAPGFALFVTIAGVMGASLFGMRSLRKRSLPTTVPQQINQLTVTGSRGVIGAISALLFYFVLQTPLMSEGTVLAEGAVTAPLMVVVGFAAGYAERMAPSVVATVASITETDANDESEPAP
jgi:hypothetical protein